MSELALRQEPSSVSALLNDLMQEAIEVGAEALYLIREGETGPINVELRVQNKNVERPSVPENWSSALLRRIFQGFPTRGDIPRLITGGGIVHGSQDYYHAIAIPWKSGIFVAVKMLSHGTTCFVEIIGKSETQTAE
jgi:hypothetical protein